MIKRAFVALCSLAGATLFGALGYRLIEGWSWLDSLYMSVLAISTVGFREVAPLSSNGKLFTIALIGLGVGVVLYFLSVLVELVVEGRLRDTLRKDLMARNMERKKNHVIVAGFGRFGRVVVGDLLQAGRSVVVVDPDASLDAELAAIGIPHIVGTASNDDALHHAGIDGAAAIVAATPSEAENVFITLAARELNPHISIHARGESESAARRLRRAGADSVTAPFQMGGSRIATSILRPSVVDFLEILSPQTGPEIDLEEIRVEKGSELLGASVQGVERSSGNCRVVAMKPRDASMRIVPEAEATIGEGDLLVVIGEREALLKLARRACEVS